MNRDAPEKLSENPRGREGGLLAELWSMLAHNKKYWLIPLIAVLLVFGALVILSGSSVAPFIYTLF